MKAGKTPAAEKTAELYRLYEKPMYHIAFAVLKDHHQAEDAVSDSFCKLIAHIDKLSAPESPETRQYIIKMKALRYALPLLPTATFLTGCILI